MTRLFFANLSYRWQEWSTQRKDTNPMLSLYASLQKLSLPARRSGEQENARASL